MKFNLFAVGIVAAGAVSAFATADTTDLTYLGVGYGQVITITSPGYNGGVNAGQLLISLSGTTGGSSYLDGSHTVFCADVYQGTGSGFFDIVPVSALPTTAPMGPIVEQGVTDLYAFAGGAQYGTDADLACAFQVAIWEVVNDYGSLDINTGNFQAAGLTAQSIAYVNLLLGAVGTNGSASLIGLANESLQDFIVEVPAPGALALVGLAGLVGTRRRRA